MPGDEARRRPRHLGRGLAASLPRRRAHWQARPAAPGSAARAPAAPRGPAPPWRAARAGGLAPPGPARPGTAADRDETDARQVLLDRQSQIVRAVGCGDQRHEHDRHSEHAQIAPPGLHDILLPSPPEENGERRQGIPSAAGGTRGARSRRQSVQRPPSRPSGRGLDEFDAARAVLDRREIQRADPAPGRCAARRSPPPHRCRDWRTPRNSPRDGRALPGSHAAPRRSGPAGRGS